MRAERTWPAILVFVLLVAAVLVFWQFESAQVASASLAAGKSRLENVISEMRTVGSSSADLDCDSRQLRKGIWEAIHRTSLAKDMDAPEDERARIRVLDSWLALKNASMYRKLGFSPAQIDQYEKLAVSHFLRMQDIVAAARAENVPMKDPAIATLTKEENQQFQDEQAAALGDAVSQQIQQFQRSSAVRSLANAVAGDTYYSNTPLTVSQADQITQILANNSAAYQKGNNASLSDIDMPTALTQAQRVLPDAQLAALTNLYEGQKAGTKVSRLIATLLQSSSSASQVQNLNTGK